VTPVHLESSVTTHLKVSSLRGLTQTGKRDLAAPAGKKTVLFFQQKIHDSSSNFAASRDLPEGIITKNLNLKAVCITKWHSLIGAFSENLLIE